MVKSMFEPHSSSRDIATLIEAIWREALCIDAVQPSDNFFDDVCGTSLQAMQVMSRIREELGINIPLAALFNSKHLESFIAIVNQIANEDSTE